MGRRKTAAADVERLSGQCRTLARELRQHADGYGFLRHGDAKFLRALAERLDDLAVEIGESFAKGDVSGVRRSLR